MAPRTETPLLATGHIRSNTGPVASWGDHWVRRRPRRLALAPFFSGQVCALMCASVCDTYSIRLCMDSVPWCCTIALILKKLLKSASPALPPLNSLLTDAVPLSTIISPRKCDCATRRSPRSVRAEHVCCIMLNAMCGWRCGLARSRLRAHAMFTGMSRPALGHGQGSSDDFACRTCRINDERGLGRSAGPPFIASWCGTPNGVAHALQKPNRVSCSPPCAGRTQPCAPSPWPFGGL